MCPGNCALLRHDLIYSLPPSLPLRAPMFCIGCAQATMAPLQACVKAAGDCRTRDDFENHTKAIGEAMGMCSIVSQHSFCRHMFSECLTPLLKYGVTELERHCRVLYIIQVDNHFDAMARTYLSSATSASGNSFFSEPSHYREMRIGAQRARAHRC